MDKYDSTDVELMRTFKMECDVYMANSKRVYDELIQLIIDGPDYTYDKTFRSKHDDRGDSLAVKCQAKSSTTPKERKSDAYNIILAVQFCATKLNFTLDHYIDAHTSSHTVLLDLKESVSETTKVSYFLTGISGPKLDIVKAYVFGIDKLNKIFNDYQ